VSIYVSLSMQCDLAMYQIIHILSYLYFKTGFNLKLPLLIHLYQLFIHLYQPYILFNNKSPRLSTVNIINN